MNYAIECRLAVFLILSSVICSEGQGQTSSPAIPAPDQGSGRLISAAKLMSLQQVGGMLGTGLSVSPDGRFVAFEMHRADVEANRYRVTWFVASTTRPGQLVNVGDGGDALLFRSSRPNGDVIGAWVSEYAKWSSDNHGIAYRKRLNGETQIWWSSRDGSEIQQLSHNAANVEEFYWSSDGLQILFATDADRAELLKAKKSRFRNGHVYDYFKDWSTIDGRPFYPPYQLTDGRPRFWALDVVSRIERLATNDERAEFERLKHANRNLKRAPNARKIAWARGNNGVAWVQLSPAL